eukprot:Nk52_evm6s2496 gene=Nk52_evmTU6s2496
MTQAEKDEARRIKEDSTNPTKARKRFILKNMSEENKLYLVRLVFEDDPEKAKFGQKLKAWESITVEFNKMMQEKFSEEKYKDLVAENVKKHFENEIYSPYVRTYHKLPDQTGDGDKDSAAEELDDTGMSKEAPVGEYFQMLEQIHFEREHHKKQKDHDKTTTESQKKEEVLIAEEVKAHSLKHTPLRDQGCTSSSSNSEIGEGKKRRRTESTPDILNALSVLKDSRESRQKDDDSALEKDRQWRKDQLDVQRQQLDLLSEHMKIQQKEMEMRRKESAEQMRIQREEMEIRRKESAANQKMIMALLQRLAN